MKEGWEYKKLGEITIKITDGSHNPPAGIDFSEYPMLSSKNIFFDHYDYIQPRYLTKEQFEIEDKRTNIEHGDVLLTIVGTVGRACCIDTPFQKFTLQRSVAVLKPNKEKILSRFLMYGMISMQNLFNEEARGAAQKGIYLKQLSNIPIPIPPLAEQERIVSILDKAFEKIDAIKANAEENLANAKALFQAALKKELTPKDGWEELALKDIGLTQTGTTPSKKDSSNYGNFIPFIRPSEIDFDGLGGINLDSEIRLSQKGLDKGRSFPKGSIFMVCIGATISKVGISNGLVSCNQQINVLIPNDGFCNKFLLYAMSAPLFKNKVIKEGTSSQATLPIINKGKWEKLTISFPKIEVQYAIAQKLESISFICRNIEQNCQAVIAECDALKQAILQKAFNGEL